MNRISIISIRKWKAFRHYTAWQLQEKTIQKSLDKKTEVLLLALINRRREIESLQQETPKMYINQHKTTKELFASRLKDCKLEK